MNEQNLKPMNTRSKDEARESGRIGGKKSGEVRRKRKTIKQQLELLLSTPVSNEDLKKQIKKWGIDDDDINNQMAVTVSLYQQALKGNTKAIEIIRDTVGEKPVEKLEHSGNIGNSLDVLKDIQKQIKDDDNAK